MPTIRWFSSAAFYALLVFAFGIAVILGTFVDMPVFGMEAIYGGREEV